MDSRIRVLLFPVGKAPEWVAIDPHDLEAMQALVGGYIELVRLGPVDLWCNEEGKLRALPPNGVVQIKRNGIPSHAHEIVGPFFLAGRKEGDDGEEMDVLPADWQDHVDVLARDVRS